MKVFLSILFASAIAASANATTPLWMRYSTISPNGEEIREFDSFDKKNFVNNWLLIW